MSCNVDGKGCRVCPGMWVAAALLLSLLFQNIFIQSATKPLPTVSYGNETAHGYTPVEIERKDERK